MTSSTEGTVDKQDQKDGNELSCLPADPKYDLFDGEGPFAVIAAQRCEAEAAEATEDEVDEQSASEDELTKALMASFEDGNHEDRLPESAASNSEESSTAPRLILSPIAQGTSGSSPSTGYKVPRINADDVNDESDEFEDVPLNIPISAAATLTPIDERTHTPQSSTLTKNIMADSTTPSPRNKEQGLSNRMPTGLNYHGLPKRYDETGAEIGYIAAPPAGHTYAYASDEPLESNDPYHTPGCRRRMVFDSDPIPEQQRYKVQDAEFEKKTNKVDFPNAVDKAYDWCQTRRGMIGATKETIEDGKLARHFILKMGPPHGLHGEATRLADRLKALVSHYFHNRLAKSHLTLETEIPYHHLAGQGYFRSYMDAIRHLMNPPSKSAKKLGERLTITLAEEPTWKFRTCDPVSFHPQPFDYEAEWTLRVGTAQHVFTETFPSTQKHMPDEWRPTPEQIEAARNAYLTRGRVANENKPAQVNAAIADIKVFLDEVERYNKPESSTDTFAQGSGAQPSLVPILQGAPVVSGRQEALEVLRTLQSYRAATASPVQAAFQIYADAAPESTMQHRSQQQQLESVLDRGQQARRRQARQMLLCAQATQNRPRFVDPTWSYSQLTRMAQGQRYPGIEHQYASAAFSEAPRDVLQQPQHQPQNRREPPAAYLGAPAQLYAHPASAEPMAALARPNAYPWAASALDERHDYDGYNENEQDERWK